jgi:uncharacterized protein YjdB
MGYNSKDELMDDLAAATATGVTITWTSNEPTAATTQTIADGTIPTVAELGQYVANNEAQIALILADIALIRADLNA